VPDAGLSCSKASFFGAGSDRRIDADTPDRFAFCRGDLAYAILGDQYYFPGKFHWENQASLSGVHAVALPRYAFSRSVTFVSGRSLFTAPDYDLLRFCTPCGCDRGPLAPNSSAASGPPGSLIIRSFETKAYPPDYVRAGVSVSMVFEARFEACHQQAGLNRRRKTAALFRSKALPRMPRPSNQTRAAQGSRGILIGNHGHAVAAAASAVGSKAVIVLPNTAPKIKVENCRWWNAEVVFYDPQREDRAEAGRALVEERGMTLVPPFDDYEIMAGQGTCGVEICEQLNDIGVVPDFVLMNCSGGGLSSGVAEAMKSVFPAIQRYVVEPAAYNKMARALASGVPEKNAPAQKSILEGILGPVVGERTLKVLCRYEVKAKTISEDDALHAMAIGFRDLKLVIEAGGAAGLAAVLTNRAEFKDQNVVVIASGGNVGQEVFARALKG
jgi:threonine dehydratase